MAFETKYSANIKVGFYMPWHAYLHELENPDEKARADKPYILDGVWYDEPIELLKATCNKIGCEYDIFGDVKDSEGLKVAFVIPGERKYHLNQILNAGVFACGPDVSLDYVTKNLDQLELIRKNLKELGLIFRCPMLYISWNVDDPEATITSR